MHSKMCTIWQEIREFPSEFIIIIIITIMIIMVIIMKMITVMLAQSNKKHVVFK